jgi:hypothetical protein
MGYFKMKIKIEKGGVNEATRWTTIEVPDAVVTLLTRIVVALEEKAKVK